MKKKFFILSIISLATVIFLLFYQFVLRNAGAGSYCYAESYEFNIDENTLIEGINGIKVNYPEYIVPVKIEEGRRDSNDYWYHFYFFYRKENAVVHFWTRPIDKQKTELAFVNINDWLINGNWKEINNDFNRRENRKVIREFEDRILNKLPLKYVKKGCSMPPLLW